MKADGVEERDPVIFSGGREKERNLQNGKGLRAVNYLFCKGLGDAGCETQ